MKLKIDQIYVSNFRSISKLTIKIEKYGLLIICGSNNVGKTNFLRALNLFFNRDVNEFNPEADIPYHIIRGARGGGNRTKIRVEFTDIDNNDKYKITANFSESKDEGLKAVYEGTKNKKKLDKNEINSILSNFKFYFVESINEDIPWLVSELVEDEILPIGLKRRKGQKKSMDALEDFIKLSEKTLSKMENQLTNDFINFTGDYKKYSGEDMTGYHIKINFPSYDKLSDAIGQLVKLTLVDTNDSPLEQKGGGIQRMILLALIEYMFKNTKKTVVWAIDEPEANLQPSLQKKVFTELNHLSQGKHIIAASHSPHFVDLSDIDNSILFITKPEIKEFARKPGETFININTSIDSRKGYEKIEAIKQHMGIQRSDSWEILPFNLLVEGEVDKQYITYFSQTYGKTPPNIITAGGANKMVGSLEFIKNYCEELDFKPYIRCLLDHDEEGKSAQKRILNKMTRNLPFSLDIKFVKKSDSTHNDNWNYMMEDMIYKELMFDAINSILRKKKYKIINSQQRKNCSQVAFSKDPFLKYIDQCVKARNPTRPPLEFSSEAFKPYICKKICFTKLTNIKVQELDKEEPAVKSFIIELIKSPPTVKKILR